MISTALTSWEIALLAAVALLICALSTALAMESAALFVPAFLLFFPAVSPNFPAVGVNEAVGLTLVIMFFGQTSANLGYWYRGQVDARLAASALVWTVPLAVVGRLVSYLLPPGVLVLVFAGLLVVLAGVTFRHDGTESDAPASGERRADGGARAGGAVGLGSRDCLAMGTGGSVTGLVGLGMGEVSTTLLTAREGMSVHRAVGTSTLVLYVTVLAAAVTNLAVVEFGGALGVEPSIPWAVAAFVAPAVLVGGQVGPYVNSRLPGWAVVRVLVVIYLAVAVVTAGRALG